MKRIVSPRPAFPESAGSGRVGLLVAFAAVAMVGASACTIGPDFEHPAMDVAPRWTLDSPLVVQGQPADPRDWWKEFRDPQLERLVDLALARNLDLHQAALRIVEARTGRAKAFITLFPLVTGSGEVVHTNLSTNVKPDVEIEVPEVTVRQINKGPILSKIPQIVTVEGDTDVHVSDSIDIYSLGGAASWELDVWGKTRRRIGAADSVVDAAFASYDDMMVSLIAEVAASYVQIRTLQERIRVNDESLETQRRFQEITDRKVEAGESPETDKYLAAAIVGLTEIRVPALVQALEETRAALAYLLAMVPGDLPPELANPTGIPIAPPAIVAGVPADLLRRRPDVRFAEHLAQAQCDRVGVAKGQILPSLSLVGAIGLSSSHSSDLFESDSVHGAYGGSLGVTGILLYPFLVQEVRYEDAELQRTMLEYQQSLLAATREVETAMAGFKTAHEQTEIFARGSVAGRKARELAVAAYDEGKVIVSVPLVALAIESSYFDGLAKSKGDQGIALIQAYRALGGGWQLREGQELLPSDLRRQMEERSDWSTFGGDYVLETRRSSEENAAPAGGDPPR